MNALLIIKYCKDDIYHRRSKLNSQEVLSDSGCFCESECVQFKKTDERRGKGEQ